MTYTTAVSHESQTEVYTNHVFTPGEEIIAPKNLVRLVECHNLPSKIIAYNVHIESSKGREVSVICNTVSISKCPEIERLTIEQKIRDIDIRECPNLLTIQKEKDCSPDYISVDNCRKFQGPLFGRYIVMRGIARLPSEIINTDESKSVFLHIENCGFVNPDVHIDGYFVVELANTHSRTMSVSASSRVYVNKQVCAREVFANAEIVSFSSKKVVSLITGDLSKSVNIQQAKNLKNFVLSNICDRLSIVGCCVAFKVPNRPFRSILIETVHPDQKNFKSFYDHKTKENVFLLKTPDNKIFCGSNFYPRLHQFSRQKAGQTMTYRKNLRRKIDLWLQQPYEN